MRQSGFFERGEKIVQLTIEVDEKDILLSDFNVLNKWYVVLSLWILYVGIGK